MKFEKIFFDTIDSTNIYLEQLAREGKPEGTVVISEHQTMGKGQSNHSWISEKGGLYFSMLIRPEKYLPLISILTGITVAESLHEFSGLDFNIKWPNDVFYNHKKISGILIESKFKGQIPEYFIIGCGININQDIMPDMPEYQATSLKIISEKEIDLNHFLDRFLERFSNLYKLYLNEGHKIIIDKFLPLMYLKGKNVKVNTFSEKITEGVIMGINYDGAMVLDVKGKEELIYSGRIIL